VADQLWLMTRIREEEVGTDKYHIQVSHHLTGDNNASSEYDQYVVYLAILNHGAIDMFSVCSHLQ